MRPATFRYLAPRSASEAIAMLAEHGEDARPLAGGQSLVPLMNLRMGRPKVVVDLGNCADLSYIEERGDSIAYGPMVRQMDAQHAALTRAHCRLVEQALALAGPVAVRNRATVGGTLAHADRSAELPAVAAALEATMVIEGAGGRRELSAAEFFLGDLTTEVQPGEMLREVRFPKMAAGTFTTFVEAGLRTRDMALAGVAACVTLGKDRTCASARLAVIGVEPAPARLRAVEAMLVSRRLDAGLIREASAKASTLVEPLTDVHASASYRRHLVGALVAQALEQAMQR
jgi:carbon-monoxide dehydrogenase medium subunit